MLLMVHPEIEMAAQALDKNAYQLVWAPRGWKLMDEPTAFANTTLERFVRSADDLDKDSARLLVAIRGGDYPDEDSDGKAAIAAYKATFEENRPAPATTTETSQGVQIKLYNPGDHPVSAKDGDDGVLAYLEAADDDERQRVLELEEAGQGRVTILNWSPPAEDTDAAPAANAGQE